MWPLLLALFIGHYRLLGIQIFTGRSSQHRLYRDADKSLARPTSRCVLFDGENISFDASLVIIQGVPGGMDKTSGECSLC